MTPCVACLRWLADQGLMSATTQERARILADVHATHWEASDEEA